MPNQKWEFGNLGIFVQASAEPSLLELCRAPPKIMNVVRNLGIFLSPLNKGEARYPHGQRAFSLLSLTFALYLCESQIPAFFDARDNGHHAVLNEVHTGHDLHPERLSLSRRWQQGIGIDSCSSPFLPRSSHIHPYGSPRAEPSAG